jgi:hypothetical protein
MGLSGKSLAMDTSLPMKSADMDPAFEKAFNAQSLLLAEPGKPVQGPELRSS